MIIEDYDSLGYAYNSYLDNNLSKQKIAFRTSKYYKPDSFQSLSNYQLINYSYYDLVSDNCTSINDKSIKILPTTLKFNNKEIVRIAFYTRSYVRIVTIDGEEHYMGYNVNNQSNNRHSDMCIEFGTLYQKELNFVRLTYYSEDEGTGIYNTFYSWDLFFIENSNDIYVDCIHSLNDVESYFSFDGLSQPGNVLCGCYKYNKATSTYETDTSISSLYKDCTSLIEDKIYYLLEDDINFYSCSGCSITTIPKEDKAINANLFRKYGFHKYNTEQSLLKALMSEFINTKKKLKIHKFADTINYIPKISTKYCLNHSLSDFVYTESDFIPVIDDTTVGVDYITIDYDAYIVTKFNTYYSTNYGDCISRLDNFYEISSCATDRRNTYFYITFSIDGNNWFYYDTYTQTWVQSTFADENTIGMSQDDLSAITYDIWKLFNPKMKDVKIRFYYNLKDSYKWPTGDYIFSPKINNIRFYLKKKA